MADIGVLAAGNLMNASAGLGQQLQKQIGQTGIPVYNVANACATGATALRTAIMAVKAGEVDIRHGRRRGKALRRRAARRRRPEEGRRRRLGTGRPLRRGRADRRPDRHRGHARCVRPDRHRIRPQVRRHQLRAFRQDQRKEPRPLDAEPACRLPEAVHARADHERRHDRLPQHPADVLGQLRWCRGRGRVQRRNAEDRCRPSSGGER